MENKTGEQTLAVAKKALRVPAGSTSVKEEQKLKKKQRRISCTSIKKDQQ